MRSKGISEPSWFNVGSVALGLAFLYLPIALLIIYSFNASRLVTIWAGWSTRWYMELLNDRAMLESAWVTLRVALLSARLMRRKVPTESRKVRSISGVICLVAKMKR